ncbi:class I SAM-dependent methyltransferase [Azospirillum halopraeferens]|uniref:class I SAM-dependent methyltransferase n=1 Tax=Azospirillum halopraeferens TaxID=34010 RepID=UPI00048B5B55|nr:class I SAM-dependent methyltransferase [Azospirillum halopraeferens]
MHPHHDDPARCPLCGAPGAAPFATVRGRRYRRCGTCRLTFLEPAQRPDAAAERAEYALHTNDPADPRYRRFLARATDPLLDRLAPGAEGLDFGCGPGPAVPAMLGERGFAVRTWDPFFAPDADALARTYDFVVCTEVAEHFHRPDAAFARIDGLLRPGGWLALMTGILRDDTAFAGWPYIREASHVVFYRPQTLDWIARRFGWTAEPAGTDVVLFGKP